MRLINANAFEESLIDTINNVAIGAEVEEYGERAQFALDRLMEQPTIDSVEYLRENGYKVSKREENPLEDKPCNSCQNDIIYCTDCKRFDEWKREAFGCETD